MHIKPLDTLSTCIGMLRDEIQKERSQANVNYSKIAALLLEQGSIIQLSCYTTFREQSLKMREQIAKVMKQLDESHNDETVKHLQKSAGAMKIISGVLSGVGSGIGGFIPTETETRPLLEGLATARTVQGFFSGGGQTLSGISGGVDHFKEMDQTKQRALQDQLNHLKDESKKFDEETSRDAEAAERNRIKAEDGIKELENAQSAAFRAVAG